jgi:hypothetical protein
MGGAALKQRVERAAEAALAEQSYVSAIDVFLGLGWLAPTHHDQWRQGRVQCLERVMQASLPKLSTAMGVFRRWAQQRGLGAQRDRLPRPDSWPQAAALQRQWSDRD